MHIVSRKRLLEFAEIHTDVADQLDSWYRVAKSASWENLVDIKQRIPLVTSPFSISKAMTIA
jgi:mRNA interferase HigB